jgi:hypothetical protein
LCIDRAILARLLAVGTIPGAIPAAVIRGALARHAASILIGASPVRPTVALTVGLVFALFTGFAALGLVALLRSGAFVRLPRRLAVSTRRLLRVPVLLDAGTWLAPFFPRAGTALLPISVRITRRWGLLG